MSNRESNFFSSSAPIIFLTSISICMLYNSVYSSKTRNIFKKSLSSIAHSNSKPPVARKIPNDVYFGINPNKPEEYRGKFAMNPPQKRIDDYYWLRDDSRSNADVINHLDQENEYCGQKLSYLDSFREELYSEMLSHLKETDEDAPYKHGKYFYYSKTEKVIYIVIFST